jgi:hypothetical protein
LNPAPAVPIFTAERITLQSMRTARAAGGVGGGGAGGGGVGVVHRTGIRIEEEDHLGHRRRQRWPTWPSPR